MFESPQTASYSIADQVLKVNQVACSQTANARFKTNLAQIFRDGTFFA